MKDIARGVTTLLIGSLTACLLTGNYEHGKMLMVPILITGFFALFIKKGE